MSKKNDITHHKTLRTLESVREPAWLWDTQLAQIIWANTSGLVFWNEHDLHLLKKRNFDRAMPGLSVLLGMSEKQLPEQGLVQDFLFWTDKGPRTVECKCTRLTSANGVSAILLQVIPEEEEEVSTEGLAGPVSWNEEPIDAVREVDTTFSNTLSEPEDQETLKEIARLLSDPDETDEEDNSESMPVQAELTDHVETNGASIGLLTVNGSKHPQEVDIPEHNPFSNGSALNHFDIEPAREEPCTVINGHDENTVEAEKHLAKVGHEIRTPLSSIIGFAELMQQEKFGEIGNPKYKGYVDNILESAQHALSLVNDLLELSKVQNGEPILSPSPIDLNSTVEHCISSLQPQTGQARLVIRQSLSKNIPSITADHRSLRQIILNLMSNAIKFTAAGGQIIVSTQKVSEQQVKLRVRDTGIGMSEADLETALLPFGQIETPLSEPSGTGLGLPLTKALTEANKGIFNISSTEGRGTMVEILFPVSSPVH